MLMELARREKEAGIKPDPEIDMFMKVRLITTKDSLLLLCRTPSVHVLKLIAYCSPRLPQKTRVHYFCH
jgi:hypothetical protein